MSSAKSMVAKIVDGTRPLLVVNTAMLDTMGELDQAKARMRTATGGEGAILHQLETLSAAKSHLDQAKRKLFLAMCMYAEMEEE